MTAQEIEDKITFEQYGEDQQTNSALFKATFTLEYFSRISNAVISAYVDPVQMKDHLRRNLRENLMRKLYDDQREALYAAIYDLRASNPLDYDERRKAESALLSAAMRQQPKSDS